MSTEANGVVHRGGHACCRHEDGTTSGPGYPTPLVRTLLALFVHTRGSQTLTSSVGMLADRSLPCPVNMQAENDCGSIWLDPAQCCHV